MTQKVLDQVGTQHLINRIKEEIGKGGGTNPYDLRHVEVRQDLYDVMQPSSLVLTEPGCYVFAEVPENIEYDFGFAIGFEYAPIHSQDEQMGITVLIEVRAVAYDPIYLPRDYGWCVENVATIFALEDYTEACKPIKKFRRLLQSDGSTILGLTPWTTFDTHIAPMKVRVDIDASLYGNSSELAIFGIGVLNNIVRNAELVKLDIQSVDSFNKTLTRSVVASVTHGEHATTLLVYGDFKCTIEDGGWTWDPYETCSDVVEVYDRCLMHTASGLGGGDLSEIGIETNAIAPTAGDVPFVDPHWKITSVAQLF